MKPTIDALDHFPVEINRIPEEDGAGFVACIPALGRLLFEGRGDTAEAALHDLRQGAVALVEEYRRRRLEFPAPPREEEDYSGRLVLRLPKSLHRRLAGEAQRDGVSLNTYLIAILSDTLQSPRTRARLDEICESLTSASRAFSMHVAADARRSQTPHDWNVIYAADKYGKAL
jgi:antitoxin HicB